MPFLIFQSLGPAELIIILAIVVVLFGASRIGDIGGSIGRGIREFRREVKEGEQRGEEGACRDRALGREEGLDHIARNAKRGQLKLAPLSHLAENAMPAGLPRP